MTIPTFSNIYVKIAAVVVALAVIGACKFYFKMPEGNPVEVVAEEVVKDETGVDITDIVSKA